MVVTDDAHEVAGPDESGLVEALQGGDAEAFRDLVTDLTPGLTRLARTYVTPALADEVVQETWAAVVRSLDRFEGRSSLKTWIYRILLNKVRTLAGREAKIVPFAALHDSEASTPGGVDPDRLLDAVRGVGHWSVPPSAWSDVPAERLEGAEVLMTVREAIDALPPAQREVVLLRDVQGWTAPEVCNALGISSANQRVLLHRGRVAVRAMLEEYLSNE